MSATRDARTAKRKLGELGITSATVLTGSATITIDLAAFDELVHRRYAEKPSSLDREMAKVEALDSLDQRRGRDGLTRIQRGPTS